MPRDHDARKNWFEEASRHIKSWNKGEEAQTEAVKEYRQREAERKKQTQPTNNEAEEAGAKYSAAAVDPLPQRRRSGSAAGGGRAGARAGAAEGVAASGVAAGGGRGRGGQGARGGSRGAESNRQDQVAPVDSTKHELSELQQQAIVAKRLKEKEAQTRQQEENNRQHQLRQEDRRRHQEARIKLQEDETKRVMAIAKEREAKRRAAQNAGNEANKATAASGGAARGGAGTRAERRDAPKPAENAWDKRAEERKAKDAQQKQHAWKSTLPNHAVPVHQPHNELLHEPHNELVHAPVHGKVQRPRSGRPQATSVPHGMFLRGRETRARTPKLPSRDCEVFLQTNLRSYITTLKDDLTNAQFTPDMVLKCKNVYLAFKNIFGRMLGECRKNCFEKWMIPLAKEDVTKANWNKVLDEASALWHAVVIIFRVVYNSEDLKEAMTNIEVKEFNTDRQGTPAPEHHISNLMIRYKVGDKNPNVTKFRWGNYTKSAFAKNAVHFVREYQKLLIHDDKDVQLFGFWFYKTDLCDWIRDLQIAMKGAEETMNSQYKMFKWPKCCRKGEPVDQDPTWCKVYTQFCAKMKLNYHDKKSQHQFRMRVRAAWLRLVGCYPYTTDNRTLQYSEIEDYLRTQHVQEIEIKQGTSNYEIMPDLSGLSALKDSDMRRLCYSKKGKSENTNRRILVAGACMSASNPYLCTPP